MINIHLFFPLLALIVALREHQVDGRAVNITNTWILPQEGFPVFYRYFRDQISWYEADAVCQFHHGNLVTVDSTAQYDAVRAYLKELDIMTNVWMGLIKSNPDGEFTWTNYQTLTGDGFWKVAPVESNTPLCAATDPAADYRWKALSCGGPEIASFICELPVPAWALQQNGGCMVHALPALTATYLPGSSAVQLTADCGLAGVKKVICTGNKNHEDLVKELSCGIPYEEFLDSATLNGTTVQTNINTTEVPLEQNSKLGHTTFLANTKENFTTSILKNMYTADLTVPTTTATFENFTSGNTPPPTANIPFKTDVDLISSTPTSDRTVLSLGSTTFDYSNNHNNAIINDNDTPFKTDQPLLLTHHESDTLGKANIFTQPLDHFIPPLVMAKSKASTDMTVVSVDKKHAQQKQKQIEKNDLSVKVPDGTVPTSTETKYTQSAIIAGEIYDKFTKLKSNLVFSTTEKLTANHANILPITSVNTRKYFIDKPRKMKKYDGGSDDLKYNYNHNKNIVLANKSNRTPQTLEEITTSKRKWVITGLNKTTILTSTSETYHSISDKVNLTLERNKSLVTVSKQLSVVKEMNKQNKSVINENAHKDNMTIIINPNLTTPGVDDILKTTSNPISETPGVDDILKTTSNPILEPVEEYETESSVEPRPKPNRSRDLTSSSHRTFYPYFINRVLG